MARKKKYVPKAFESGKAGDVSANIYASMIQSRAWMNLTNNARVLYVYMKLQYYGQKTIPGRGPECFYFNKALFIKTYQLYKNANQFYKDKKLLIDNGFIEAVENGKTTRTKSAYKLSSKWRDFNLAISNMLPLKDEKGIYFVTTIKKSFVYVVAKIIPLYLILMGITGSIIHTLLKTEKTEGYTTSLPFGKENTISTNELAVIMGFNDSRSLQADIAKSRNAGQIILSSTQGGYYLPKDDAEVQEFVAFSVVIIDRIVGGGKNE